MALALTQAQWKNASSNRRDTANRRDLNRAEENVRRHFRAYRRARGALQRLNAPNKVMEIYKPILLKDLTLSGDVVEENRLGQRSDVLAWFWHIGAPNGGQRDEWMEECESSSTNAPPVDSTKDLKFTG